MKQRKQRVIRQRRGIKEAAFGDSLRFHPKLQHPFTHEYYPALVGIARDEGQQICEIQATYLNAETAMKARIDQTKITRGSLGDRSCGVLINQGEGSVILVAEGIETALSLKEAQPESTIYATLGISNFAHVSVLDGTKKVIFCADNDGVDAPSAKLLEKAAEQLANKGVDVWLTMPEKTKQDFNDVLLLRGVEGVKALLNKASIYRAAAVQKDGAEQGIISKEVAQKLYDYIKKYQNYEQLALQAVRSFGKPNERINKEQALLARDAHRREAMNITKDKELWDKLCSLQKNKIPDKNFDKLGGIQKIEGKLLDGNIAQGELDVVIAHIRGTSSSLSMSRRRGRGR